MFASLSFGLELSLCPLSSDSSCSPSAPFVQEDLLDLPTLWPPVDSEGTGNEVGLEGVNMPKLWEATRRTVTMRVLACVWDEQPPACPPARASWGQGRGARGREPPAALLDTLSWPPLPVCCLTSSNPKAPGQERAWPPQTETPGLLWSFSL